MQWSYAVTTVPSRRSNLLPSTLKTLKEAGFPSPHLFVDGEPDASSYRREFGLEVTCRFPTIRTFGNWFLGLGELYVRSPHADYFAMFQDDFLAYKNLKEYLDKTLPNVPRAYFNLFSFRENDLLCLTSKRVGWLEASALGQSKSDTVWQTGRGAMALIFPNAAVCDLLTRPEMVLRVKDHQWGHRNIDGGIVNAMNKAGWREYIHNPSLIQHTGVISSMHRDKDGEMKRHKNFATTFKGDDFDALTLLHL